MAATRRGVATRPSRDGSSPMAVSNSATNVSTRSTSTLTGCSLDGDRTFVDAHVGEIPVALGHVESVAHHEIGRDLESHVAQIEFRRLPAFLHQQGAHL